MNRRNYQSSAQYLFVRGRQLEGTFPGDADTGTWPITAWRIMRGWGVPPEEAWPNIDAIAKCYPGGRYQRVRRLEECKAVIAIQRSPVVVSLDITDKWRNAPGGRIPELSPDDESVGVHCVLLLGYDDEIHEFTFQNSWGEEWGDHGLGHISYDVLESTWTEGWLGYIPEEWHVNTSRSTAPGEAKAGVIEQRRGSNEHGGGVFHAREFVRAADGEVIGWSFAVERGALVEIEELFVRPSFRMQGYGRRLIRQMAEIADVHGADLIMWVPFPDAEPANLLVVQKLIVPVGLSLSTSYVRWAACVASTGGGGALSEEELREFIPPASLRPRAFLVNRGR
jgi:GNAT superfamily N-acetyltransferase